MGTRGGRKGEGEKGKEKRGDGGQENEGDVDTWSDEVVILSFGVQTLAFLLYWRFSLI